MESGIPSAENLEFRVIAQQAGSPSWDPQRNARRQSGLYAVLVGIPAFPAMPDIPDEDSQKPTVDP
jgi:hypothetical protein